MNSFVDRLEEAVRPARARLLDAPLFRQLRDGTLTRAHYARFLVEVYHYAKHTPRLLAAASSKLSQEDQGLFERFMENAHEEAGHDRWALQDLHALGWDPVKAAESDPLPATDALVAYSYFVINYVDPRGLLGSNYALETLGSGAASEVAVRLKQVLGIGDDALTFIAGHGEADQHHVLELKKVTEGFARTPEIQRAVIRAAQVVYALYTTMMHDIWAATQAADTP